MKIFVKVLIYLPFLILGLWLFLIPEMVVLLNNLKFLIGIRLIFGISFVSAAIKTIVSKKEGV